METYNIEQAAMKSRVSEKDIADFYKMRGYLKPEKDGYSATILGIEKNCVINDNNYRAKFTLEGVKRVADAFIA